MTAQVQTPRPESTSLFSPASKLTKLADDPESKRPKVNTGGSLQDLMGSKTTKQVTVAVIGAGQRGLVRFASNSRVQKTRSKRERLMVGCWYRCTLHTLLSILS